MFSTFSYYLKITKIWLAFRNRPFAYVVLIIYIVADLVSSLETFSLIKALVLCNELQYFSIDLRES